MNKTLKQKKHILVVDDEPSWQIIIQHLLENKGFEVKAVGSGAEALLTLASFKPDLIMSDVRMPEMNGFDFLYTIKQIPAASSTPVVFFSAIDDFDARKMARTLGAADYLVKPFNEQEVELVLAKYLI